MNNIFSASRSLGVKNGFGEMYNGNWTSAGSRVQWRLGSFFAVILLVAIIITPHSDPLISGFVRLK